MHLSAKKLIAKKISNLGRALFVVPLIRENPWRYRPMILDGEAVAVETYITVNIMMDAQ